MPSTMCYLRNKVLLLGKSLYCNYSTAKPQPNLNDFFSDERKAKLVERILKMQQLRPASKVVGLNSSKNAAVLVPFVIVNQEPSLLFTIRSQHLRIHGGEVSYPGGKFDEKFDKVIEDSALREAEEELGLKREIFDVWGKLNSVQSRDGSTAITPVVGLLKDKFSPHLLKVNPAEVSSVFTCTIKELCSPDNLNFTQFRAGYTLPVYFGEQPNKKPKIWGLTAIITHMCLSVVAPELYRHRLPYVSKVVGK